MADLAKAMQTAAEGARTDTLEKFAADAKTHIEAIQTDSATEAADLRRQADDDIAGIRDWSKAEISRIREETEHRITGRKTGLDSELDDHAASTERRIARVQARVDAFEAEMAYFFEVLLAEQDPTKLASMAQSLPEPPDFDDEIAEPAEPAAAAVQAPERRSRRSRTTPGACPSRPASRPKRSRPHSRRSPPRPRPPTSPRPLRVSKPKPRPSRPRPKPGSASRPDSVEAAVEVAADDPRMAALALSPDAAAEAEAASFEAGASSDDDIPTIDDDALAARIAGLVPDADAAAAAERAQGRDRLDPGRRGGPGQRRQHRRLQAPPRSRRRCPVGRRLVRPRR